MGVSFILAFTYYIQIFKFAKREQAEFEEALAAAQAAIQASHHTASENGTSINGNRAHWLYLNLNEQKTSHFYRCIQGMLETSTISK